MVKNLKSGKKTLDEYEINFIELRKDFDSVDIPECVAPPRRGGSPPCGRGTL